MNSDESRAAVAETYVSVVMFIGGSGLYVS